MYSAMISRLKFVRRAPRSGSDGSGTLGGAALRPENLHLHSTLFAARPLRRGIAFRIKGRAGDPRPAERSAGPIV